MKHKLLWFVTALPAFITIVVMPYMDEKVPMHYDINGTIDRYGSKYENFIFPVIIFCLTLFWLCFLTYFKKKEQKSTSEKEAAQAKSNGTIIYVTATAMAIMFGIMQCAALYSDLAVSGNHNAAPLDISMVMNITAGVFLIIIGNYLPRSRRNSIVGIRTPWSMENDEVWSDSNRFGGKVLIAAGIGTIGETLFLKGIASTFLMLAIIIAASVICTVYSCSSYKRYKEREK